ncbi:hypothetical protein FQR65_LT16659 [Abscondita terminalis]|nr:hypothetical protein FQR65_LT16659 [Abscondita terminalis]
MTTKMHQKISSVLAGVAIIVLLTVIIVVWVQVDHGAFKTKQDFNGTSMDGRHAEMTKLSNSSRLQKGDPQGCTEIAGRCVTSCFARCIKRERKKIIIIDSVHRFARVIGLCNNSTKKRERPQQCASSSSTCSALNSSGQQKLHTKQLFLHPKVAKRSREEEKKNPDANPVQGWISHNVWIAEIRFEKKKSYWLAQRFVRLT